MGDLAGKQPAVPHPTPLQAEHLAYYNAPAGEHYRLLAHLAAQHARALIVDIGTFLGLSALALSGGSNRVLSLDVVDRRLPGLPGGRAIEFRLANMLEDERAFPLEAELAVLDISPHDGEAETAVLEQLVARGWRGRLLCDDIHLNEGMERFWALCGRLFRTEDLTARGHSTGSGLVLLGCPRTSAPSRQPGPTPAA